MTITCPGCSARYTVQPQLFGPSGSRICCPACWLTFVLGPAGELAAVLGRPEQTLAHEAAGPDAQPHTNGPAGEDCGPPESAGETPEPASFESRADSAALAALHALDDPPGSLAAAAAEGRLFAEHGAALVTAFEALQHELPGADVALEFREALYELTGADLTWVKP